MDFSWNEEQTDCRVTVDSQWRRKASGTDDTDRLENYEF